MTYRSLLVHLDQDRRADARIAYALQVARALDCHVVGAAPTGMLPATSEVSTEAAVSLEEYAEAAWNALRQRAEAARARFDSACKSAGLRSCESIAEHDDKARSLVRLSHCSDVVVLSQADPQEPDFPLARHLVADVVLRSARPTLLLPFAGTFASVATRVIVAWDDSREAARAVSDALPLLRLAQRVRIVTWKESTHDNTVWQERQRALRQWLLWQGVTADSEVARSETRLAEDMLSRAADFEADLFVMGAYGHPRWSERVLGGATQGMLSSMTMPVLMSH